MGTNWDVSVTEGREDLRRTLDFDPDTVDATPFQHPAWLGTWLDTFGADGRRRPVMARVADARGRVVMRLPLSFERFSRVVGVWRPWDGGVGDYNGPIVARDFRPDAAEMRALWARIVAALPAGDVVVVDKMPARLGDRVNPLTLLDGTHASFNRRHAVGLDGDPATTRSRFDGTLMRSLARKRRKLANKGRLTFDLLAAPAAGPAFAAALAWRASRFAEENVGRESAAVDAFFGHFAATAPIARVGVLALDGRPLAAGLGSSTGASFQLVATGFDEAFKNWSPGLILVEEMIAAVEAAGARVFDFTIGAEAYKRDFGVSSEPLIDLFTPRGALGRLAVWWRLRRIAAMRRAEAGRGTGMW